MMVTDSTKKAFFAFYLILRFEEKSHYQIYLREQLKPALLLDELCQRMVCYYHGERGGQVSLRGAIELQAYRKPGSILEITPFRVSEVFERLGVPL